MRAIALLSLLLVACSPDPQDSAPTVQPAPDRAEEPAPWDAPGSLDESAFPWGLQSGDVTSSGVVLAAWTTESEVTLTVVQADGAGWAELLAGLELSVEDGALRHELTDLEPDSAYRYAFYTADGQRRSRPGLFRTAPDDDGHRKLVFGATHGLKGNQPWPNLSWAALEDLDFFMLLGDTVYADGADEHAEYREYWQDAFSQEGLQDLAASTSFVATWDDHEVANNWLPGELDEGQFDDALAAYREALPQREGPGGSGVWRQLSWGNIAELFVLDCRGERTATDYLSQAQLDWLKDGLSTSSAPFKLVLNSVPISDFAPMMGDILAEDRWQGYPADRQEILEHVVDTAIPGVLWLTGDFHMTTVNKVDQPGGLAEDQWEVMAGPSGSTLNPMGALYAEDEQFVYADSFWNYTWFELDPGAGTVLVRFVDDEGEIAHESEIAFWG